MFGFLRTRSLFRSVVSVKQFVNFSKVPVCFFSGHSHWATIKHDKADKDIKKSNLYAKLSKSISCAVQQGGPDPSTNLKLEAAISAARAASMPKENIERALNGKNIDASKLQSITYEGFGKSCDYLSVTRSTDQ